MASVHKRPASQFWHAAFRGPDGRLILRSTKKTNRTEALVVALEFERAAKLAQRGELVEAQAREVLADIMKRANMGETLQKLSIQEHFEHWRATKEARRSAGTAVRYELVVREFLKSLEGRQRKALTALTARDVEHYLNQRIQEGLSAATVVLHVKIIRTALNHARRQGLIPTNPAEAVELPEVETVERGTFAPAEVAKLVRTAEGEWKTLIALAYFTGARLGDCCRMRRDQVKLEEGTLSYTQGKTGEMVTIPLHPELKARLETVVADLPAKAAFLMPEMAEMTPGGRNGLSQKFKRLMGRAKLDAQKVETVGARQLYKRTFHALRHSFTSGLANANVAPELRMKLTGHKTERVHQKYTHHELEVLRQAVGKLPGLKKTAEAVK